ncbi:MAG: UDP-N-acetylmuramoyl-L-alanyl-D-glutamate--2,6-diaminopimelate ligase [Actinobacteria bacterium]|nr:UDP-N-acetylmuramoyl-L-alanyl-D-glutamate--2,6-diaminopimelate ligase [Actinomycetota bacterium]MBW3641748.1 UDP-N-acetylmuramoyl-L-alanyl-D-glutamate--2,6-diaminopimelate ligase [Actinomycetota bacterium]
MRLDVLVAELDVETVVGALGGVEVAAVTHDSRLVEDAALFCCLPGARSDGHRHAAEAVARGASALISQRPLDLDVPQLVVADARLQMARAAAAFWAHPSRRLQVVGVTGTNGKTTTVWLLRSVLEAAGRPTGMIGTLGGPRTTPEATELQATLAELADDGAWGVAMEVSSHALALARVESTWFSTAVFTNLSREHLDFHESMEDYFAVKARLFEPRRAAAAVVNLDDPHGRLLLESAQVPTVGYSLADVSDVEVGLESSTGTWRGQRLLVPLGGAANLANALAAATVAAELGVDLDVVSQALAEAPPVPGRYERIDGGQPFAVVVDYAHTPHALEQLLIAARSGAGGAGGDRRVVAVFGCGGDRDREKRPLMGRVAARLADLVILTSDNPRSEEPRAIIEQVMSGAEGPGEVRSELDRRSAIRSALEGAAPGDVVVVAGKGHETTQVTGGRTVDFDDRAVAREELARLGFAAPAR